MSKETCPECGEEYQRVSQHWRHNPSHRPSFTQHQKEVIIGLLMGDGCISTSNKNPYIISNMISKNYLEYVDNIFGILGNGVKLSKTAKQSAEEDRNSEFNRNAEPQNYCDVYYWQSRSHPELLEFVKWYSSGEKIWPNHIELTPTVLKHWYCGDGTWETRGTSNCISFAMANEVDNTEKVTKMFENVNLPPPSNYNKSQRKNGSYKCNAVFTVEGSKELWDYMGEPLSDFKYKWPEKYH